MNIDIIKLKNSIETEVEIDCEVSFNEEDVKDNDMLELNPVLVKGKILKTSLDNYHVMLNATGKMVLPCALTLKPVDYPFVIDIDEIFSDDAEEMSK